MQATAQIIEHEPDLITQETKGSEKHYYFADKLQILNEQIYLKAHL